ncbi:hypothetical protein EI546_15200 [Aequorivita sp. H23M31]|uniref:YtxH domain-containing protein n=1 Tax=Aequorivita ciconiae TaxID=2494375 RepID=A0A410G6Q0_9FLAO|nr:hypothetical protein [Aequorivita sp. H23M31]QAA82979.1 hypothetical protein EI546_15200 [Aequorivita sp. H23M31]
MRKLTMIALLAGFFTLTVSSCRDTEPKKTQTEEIIDDMQNKGADIKVKDDKIKMETEDEKVKIKTDDDGNTKIKQKDKE